MAQLFKLLIVRPDDSEQELIEVEQSGRYFDNSRVLWDERVDGIFPPALIPSLGGIERSGDILSVNQTAADDAKTRRDAKKAIQDAKRVAKDQAHLDLGALDIDNLGQADLLAVVKALLHAR